VVRLFVAVELGDEVLQKVDEQVQKLRRRAPEAKWVDTHKMHVTLVFLGQTDEARAGEVGDAVRAAAAGHEPMTISVERGGGFGGRKAPRVLWIGLAGEIEALGRLQQDVARRMAALGFEMEERPFKPHLTLARSREQRGDSALARCVEALEGQSFGSARVSELVLFESKLSPKGAQYIPLVKAPLGAAGSPCQD
jgi:2'-5' RNA ligase